MKDIQLPSNDHFHLLKNNKVNYHPAVATSRSQFTALYPNTRNPGNICISQLTTNFLFVLEKYFFVPDLTLPKKYRTKNHYIFSRKRPPVLLTIFDLIAFLTVLCFTIVQVFFHFNLHLRHYQLSSICLCVKCFVNKSHSSMMRSVAELKKDLDLIHESGVWIDFASHLSPQLYVAV